MAKIVSKFNFILLGLLILALFINYTKIFPLPLRDYLLIVLGILATVPVVISAAKALKNKRVTIDLLAAIALFVSLLEGQWASAVFINLMITSARIFGDYTEARARAAIKSLIKLRPEKVKIRKAGQVIEVPISQTKIGDLAMVEAGDRIGIDGSVIEGEGSVDQSSLTGESIPVLKSKGSKVFSSTLNIDGSLVVKVEKTGKDTTFEKIIALVETAQGGKIAIQTTADKFATFYVFATIVGSTILYLISRNLTLVLSVLLVTCADDIAVAIPMAFWASIGYAAKRGIIIKGGNFLEGLANIKTLVADKTGTLTRGQVKTDFVVGFDGRSENDILKTAAIAESVSEHPMAKAIVEEAKKKSLVFETPEEFHEYPGKGIVAEVDHKKIKVGRLSFLKESDYEITESQIKQIQNFEEKGFNVVAIGENEKIIGFVAQADEVRPEAGATIEKLKSLGIHHFLMLTGDNERVALKVAHDLGISEFRANLLPEDKVKIVKELVGKQGKVAMVGDGVNDAASLAAADVGIAMGAMGSDAAIEAADIALMQNNFAKVSEAVSLGKYTRHIAGEDFLIWGITNSLGLILVFGRVIGPEGAAAFNFITDFFPLANSIRVFRRYLTSTKAS